MNFNTMLYWHKLEHFYPYILEEQHNDRIKTFYINECSDFPDLKNPGLAQNMQVRYYEVYLGIFKVDSALKVLAKKMQAEKEFQDESDEVSCFCKFRLSPDGLFDKKSFKISSFPWAVQRVQQDRISIEQWDEDFQSFQRIFFIRFFERHHEITYDILEKILKEIVKIIGWSIKFDNCWMRIDRVIGEKRQQSEISDSEDEERNEEDDIVDDLIKSNDLLNSFYVRDLEKINEQIRRGNYGEALDEYVEHHSKKHIDIEKDKEVLLKIFNPIYIPRGKWPSGFALRGMQQTAVNLAVTEELCSEKVFSVNGPPGTGKTTLLRDIIAAKVVERAEKLMQLEKPDDVFSDVLGDVEYKGFKSYVKELNPEFKNYGILVASNNNSAVRNITTELPMLEAIAPEYREKYQYFSPVSDRVLNKDTWGICAAALGNKRNRENFINEFWPVFEGQGEKYNLNQYLRSIHTGVGKRTQKECIENWRKAKEKFNAVYEQVTDVYKQLQDCYSKIIKEHELYRVLEGVKKEYLEVVQRKNIFDEQIERKAFQLQLVRLSIEQKERMKEEIKNNTAFFCIKYWMKNKLKDFKLLEKDIIDLIVESESLSDELERMRRESERIGEIVYNYEKRIGKTQREIEEYRVQIEKWSVEHNCVVPDDRYLFQLTEGDSAEKRREAQCVSPWNDLEVIKLRERLFLEAMELHQVFVENSPQMRVQLDTFGKLMRDMLNKEDATKFSAPLIQSFQLMVPVISTTFASVGSFLRNAGKDTFGLLLIDEAGQALPQSAPGAIWRSRRCIVVGDPLQIEPVVTIHDKTIQFLKEYFSQSDFIASKDTSVQSLADQCNSYGGYRYYNEKELWIGAPLLVHGRCQKAIFDIANKIAYNEKMIYGTKDKETTACVWKNVVGNAVNKHFVQKQAESILPIVVDEFNKAWRKNMDTPSLFIISPFRSVKAGMMRYFLREDFLYYRICKEEDREKKRQIRNWIYSNIGTIHTFQGKEADMVLICLGVDSGNRGYKAVEWAGEKPNILNVAVTRAKERLYIVGDANKWTEQEYFRIAYDICMHQ